MDLLTGQRVYYSTTNRSSPMIRAKFITELKRENAMRRKVWPRVPGSQAEFFDFSHQDYYQQTTQMLEFFEAMTDLEFYKVNERIDRQKKDEAAQTSLF